MRIRRIWLCVVSLCVLAVALPVHAVERRAAEGRPDVTEVGPPVLISRDLLRRETERNSALHRYIARYGWPDYAEIQEVTVHEPLAAYEVRIYYIRRNHYLAYSRVHVSPALENYGVRVYEGKIPDGVLARLLTPVEAQSMDEEARAPGMGEQSSVADLEAAVERLELAAERAARAAREAEQASLSAERSAHNTYAALGPSPSTD